MIDYEVKIFNNVHDAVAPLCAPKRFVSRQPSDFTKLPAAGLWEMSNRTIRTRQTSTPKENFARLTYQFEAVATTKTEAKKIYKAADDRMISMNFTRISGDFIEYPDDVKIVRYVARYEVEIDEDGNLYRSP